MRINGLTGYTIWPLAPALIDVVEKFQAIYHAPDPGALLVVLATYAAYRSPSGKSAVPLWTMIVGGPATGKTDMLKLVGGLQEVREVSTLTVASLLSGTKKKEQASDASGGLLRQIGEQGFISFREFNTVLNMPREALYPLLAALREVHDGSFNRYIGTDGGRLLSWTGRVGMIAGCTTAIDNHHSVMALMGERFLFYRMPETTEAEDESTAQQAETNDERDMSPQLTSLRIAVSALLENLPGVDPTLDKEEYRWCKAGLAVLAARCRSQITREGGSHAITVIHAPEGPARIAGQLSRLDAGLAMIGVSDARRYQILRKTVLNSIPPVRAYLLDFLVRAPAGGTTMGTLIEGAEYSESTIIRAIEDLKAHHVVERTGTRGSFKYHLRPEWAERLTRTPRGSYLVKNKGESVVMEQKTNDLPVQ